MTVQPSDTTTPVTPQEPAAAAPEAPKPTAPPAPAQAPAEPPANPWDNPEAAKAEIERLRRENGAARTNAKAQAADEARTELAQTIGKALGLVKDEPIDPAKLTEQLTAKDAEARQAKVALAVYQSAGAAGADPLALLDSATFQAKVASIDPADTAAIAAAITEAVAANPRLGAAPGQRVPAPNPAQGSSASGPPPQLSLEEQIAELEKAGDFKAAGRLKANALLELRKNTN